MYKRLLVLIIIMCMFTVPVAAEETATIDASATDYVTLDISGGRIDGMYADFYFIIPDSWKNFMTAERMIPRPNSIIRERITLYFIDKNGAKAYMMSLLVFDTANWNDNYPFKKILETQRYIFATDTAKTNNLENKTDRSLFNNFMKSMESTAFIIDHINLPADDVRIMKNSLTINGVTLNGKSKVINESIYLPIREICEFIGYRVTYIKEIHAITITNNSGYYRMFMINGGSVNEGIRIIIDNDMAYASNIYFFRDLKVNMDIDENYNVNMRY